jgi:hypothetical protein
MVRNRTRFTGAVLIALIAPGPGLHAAAAGKMLSQEWGLSVFPAKGQTRAAQDKDEFDCYQWAKENTGIDPLAPAQASSKPSDESGEVAKGALKGAALGALAGAGIGAIAGGKAKKGAAIGAVAGTVGGAAQTHKDVEESQEKAAAEQKAAADKTRSAFNNGFAACLEGKGYTVK